VALYREGDSGEPVRDIQRRLTSLGYSTEPDSDGAFGPATTAAVKIFQLAHNLTADGLVGRETWRNLVDAGFRLGDRLLYHKLPMFHGDDVATLQRDLNALGFDAGQVDGIFGPATLRALLDFQDNRRMATDGIAGPAVVGELTLLVRATHKLGRHVVRERAWLRSLPSTVAGQRLFIDPFCRDEAEADAAWESAVSAASALRHLGAQVLLSRSADTRPAERSRARQANELAADIVLCFCLPRTDVVGVYFFCSTMSRSEAGEALATSIAHDLRIDTQGRTMPILRETRAPAIVVAVDELNSDLGADVARGVEAWLSSRLPQPSDKTR
jgi:N-acetylmuramoyl-L-alanine amidase